MYRHPDDPDWAWDDNPQRTAMDYELNAQFDRWDGYGDPDPCDDPHGRVDDLPPIVEPENVPSDDWDEVPF